MLQIAIEQILLPSWWGSDTSGQERVEARAANPNDSVSAILEAINSAPDPVGIRWLCEKTGLSVSCVRHHAPLLVRKGLIQVFQEKKGASIQWQRASSGR